MDSLVKHLKSNPQRTGYLYISSAKSDAQGNPQQLINASLLRKRLSSFSNEKFKFKVEHIENSEHYPMAIPGLLSAIDFSFPSKELEVFRDIIKTPGNALAKIDTYYDELSSKYGYQIHPAANLQRNVNSLRGIGYILLREDRNVEAIDVFSRWTEVTPDEPNAFDSLADAYESIDKNDLAFKAHQRAVAVAKRLNDPQTEFYQKMFTDFKTRIAK